MQAVEEEEGEEEVTVGLQHQQRTSQPLVNSTKRQQGVKSTLPTIKASYDPPSRGGAAAEAAIILEDEARENAEAATATTEEGGAYSMLQQQTQQNANMQEGGEEEDDHDGVVENTRGPEGVTSTAATSVGPEAAEVLFGNEPTLTTSTRGKPGNDDDGGGGGGSLGRSAPQEATANNIEDRGMSVDDGTQERDWDGIGVVRACSTTYNPFFLSFFFLLNSGS